MTSSSATAFRSEGQREAKHLHEPALKADIVLQQRGRPGTATLPGGGGKSHLNGYIDAESWVKESSPTAGGCSLPSAEKPRETTALVSSAYPQLSARCPRQEPGSAPDSLAATPASPSGKGPGPAAAGRSAGSPQPRPGRSRPGSGVARTGPEAGPRPSGACAAGKGRSGPREAPLRRHDVWGFSHLSASPRGTPLRVELGQSRQNANRAMPISFLRLHRHRSLSREAGVPWARATG